MLKGSDVCSYINNSILDLEASCRVLLTLWLWLIKAKIDVFLEVMQEIPDSPRLGFRPIRDEEVAQQNEVMPASYQLLEGEVLDFDAD